jgi:Rieske Fe-S protein
MEETHMEEETRREFLGRSGAVVIGTTACLCGLGGCATFTKTGSTPPIPEGAYSLDLEANRVEIELGKVPQLAESGGSVKIRDATLPDPLIIARTAEETYLVASIECPHRAVEVEYQPETGGFECASLGSSQFAGDGSRLSGPAKEPLRIFRTSFDADAGGRLIIELSA